jgi:flagellar biosynthesis protein FliQ
MTEDKHESGHSEEHYPAALSRAIHIGIPIASIIVVLAFAIVALFLPADKSTLPVESTTLFIPIYLAIVVTLVFGSMYLFKRVMDTEDSEAPPSPAH